MKNREFNNRKKTPGRNYKFLDIKDLENKEFKTQRIKIQSKNEMYYNKLNKKLLL